MSLEEKIDKNHLPQHVAIIMDGNGRWAKARGLERYMGHQEGVVSVRKVVEAASDLGIKYLTMYTFSTENWNRPIEEVHALMTLMVAAIKRETPDLMKNNVRLDAIGDLSRLPEEARNTLQECIEETSVNTRTTVVLAQIAGKVKDGDLDIAEITESTVSEHLTTRNIPDPDLLIRTGGEQRLSNFLLWQLSYAEFYFTNVYWPDFRKEELFDAILYYQQRERRFGKTSEQLIL